MVSAVHFYLDNSKVLMIKSIKIIMWFKILFFYRGIFTIFAVIVLVVIGLIGWCVWRFMKKKKPKGAEDKKAGEDDENALVDNEEANIEDVS